MYNPQPRSQLHGPRARQSAQCDTTHKSQLTLQLYAVQLYTYCICTSVATGIAACCIAQSLTIAQRPSQIDESKRLALG